MRILKKVLKALGALLLLLVALVAFLLWWTHPKRPVTGVFVRDAGARRLQVLRHPEGSRSSAERRSRATPEAPGGDDPRAEGPPDVGRHLARGTSSSSSPSTSGKYNDRPIAAGRNPRLLIPPLLFSDGPRGVVLNHSTAFPVAMARGATFDRDSRRAWPTPSARSCGPRAPTSTAASASTSSAIPAGAAPRRPTARTRTSSGRWRRSMIEGVQRHNVMACAKHFALNSIEEPRNDVDVRVDERTLREVYLPHFKRAVDAGVASVMSAYNRVNGDYCGENRHLLREVLKEEWGFRGLRDLRLLPGRLRRGEGRERRPRPRDARGRWSTARSSSRAVETRRGGPGA